MDENLKKKKKFSMALFYQVQFKAGYQPFVVSTYIQL